MGHLKTTEDGRVRVWYDLGPDPITGGRRQRTKTFGSRVEAERFLEELEDQKQAGVVRDPKLANTRMEVFVDTYLDSRHDLRPSSWESCRSRLHTHVVPRLGSRRVGEVTPDLLSVLYKRMLDEGVSASTVRKVHTNLHTLFAHAVLWRYIRENPCDGAIVPKHTPAEHPTWTADQVATFLKAVEDHPLRVPLVLSATTGMRRGEVCGVKWEHVDLDGQTIRVVDTRLEVGGRLMDGAPKSRRGQRSVSLPDWVAELLRLELLERRKHRLATGEWTEYLTTVRPGQLTKTFHTLCEGLGLPQIRLHDLRHTWGTLAVAAGIDPKTVSDNLGHASVRFTLDTYSHKVEEAHREAAQTMGRILGGG